MKDMNVKGNEYIKDATVKISVDHPQTHTDLLADHLNQPNYST